MTASTIRAIAASMGWVRDKKSNCWINAKTKIVECDPYFRPHKVIDHAKLLQARLRKEGWRIEIIIHPRFGFRSSASKIFIYKHDRDKPIYYQIKFISSEEAALAALYCRVKNIEVGV